MYLFGGYLAQDNQIYQDISNIVFRIDLSTGEVSKILSVGKSPCPRRLHSAVIDDKNMIISCGLTDEDGPNLNDVWIFSISTII